MQIIDISLPIHLGMPVWPDDPQVALTTLSAINAGETANVTQVTMCVHTGTHIDAPRHFMDDGKTIDQVPLNKLIGETLVLEIDDEVDVISEQVLKAHPNEDLLHQAAKVLFKTRNSTLWHTHTETFQTDYVGIDTSGAVYLAKLHLDLVGVDYLSVAAYEETVEPHQCLLSQEIVLLEGIDLSGVKQGFYELYCLPLNIRDCDGAPARAVLIDPTG